MTLKELYSNISKIMEMIEEDPVIKANFEEYLDTPVQISVLPISCNANDLSKCGTYGVGNIKIENNKVIISNY